MSKKNDFLPKYFICILVLVTCHAFLMNGYYLVHKQLNVGTYLDPIKAKADPTLFKNSIYVQAVNRTNVRLSPFYNVNILITKYFDFETFAIILAIVSLFFCLAGFFALTRVLFHSSVAGYIAMLLYSAALNNWTLGSPAPYLNFFHHGMLYANPLIIWSMVFFFQKRYVLALFLAGLAWNFHPMCTVFVLWAYGLTWLFNIKELRFKTLTYACAAFALPALPAMLNGLSYLAATQQPDYPLWITAARWAAWYTCFPSTWPVISLVQASLFFALFIIAVYTIPDGERKRELLIFTCSVLILCLAGTIFADIYPVPFILKLSLWRSTLIYLLIALPCIAYLLTSIFKHSIPRRFLVIALIVLLTGYIRCFPLYYLPLFMCGVLFFIYEDWLAQRLPRIARMGIPLFFTVLALLVSYHLLTGERGLRLLIFFLSTAVFCTITAMLEKRFSFNATAWTLWMLFFVVLFDAGTLYYRGGPEIYYHGRFQGKRDPWADIQMFAQTHSAKDDLFIVPTYMNDFGVYSLRATLGDWAEGANAIYLDNQFTREWLTRMKDLGWKKFCFDSNAEGYYCLPTSEVVKTAKKYGVKYIITEKPKTFALHKIYENEQFILYSAPHYSAAGST